MAFGGVQVQAQLPDPRLAAAFGDVAAEHDQVAGLHKGQVGRRRGAHGEQFDVQRLQGVIDAHGGLGSGGLGGWRRGESCAGNGRLRLKAAAALALEVAAHSNSRAI